MKSKNLKLEEFDRESRTSLYWYYPKVRSTVSELDQVVPAEELEKIYDCLKTKIFDRQALTQIDKIEIWEKSCLNEKKTKALMSEAAKNFARFVFHLPKFRVGFFCNALHQFHLRHYGEFPECDVRKLWLGRINWSTSIEMEGAKNDKIRVSFLKNHLEDLNKEQKNTIVYLEKMFEGKLLLSEIEEGMRSVCCFPEAFDPDTLTLKLDQPCFIAGADRAHTLKVWKSGNTFSCMYENKKYENVEIYPPNS